MFSNDNIDCCLKLLFAVNIFSHHGLFFFKGNFSGKETVDIFKKVTDRTDLKRHEVRVRSNLLVTHQTKRFFFKLRQTWSYHFNVKHKIGFSGVFFVYRM